MKKLISFLICVAMLFGMLPTNALATEKFDAQFSHEIISLFENTGVLEKNDPFVTKTDPLVTRSEFARLLVRIIACSDTALTHTNYEPLYADVKESTRNYQEIIFASKLGLFGDRINNYFYPNDTATANWAALSLASALGYGQHIKVNQASVYSLNLLDGVISKDGYLRRDGALKMLYNALEVPVIETVGMSGGDLVLKSTDNRNFLDVYFKIYSNEEVLLGDYFTSVSGEKPDRGYVHFSSGIYGAQDLPTENLVGLNLKYYYTQDDNDNKILHFEKMDNVQLVLSHESAIYDYYKNCYVAEIDGREKTLSMELGTLVSYNGKPHFDKNKMLPVSGQVTLVDNDGDNKYEVCMIREYKNIVVDAIDVSCEKIFDSLDSSRNINTASYENFFVYNAKGEELNLSDLEKDTVVTLYVSADSKDAFAYVSEKSAALKLEETNLTENKVVADGATYSLSSDFRMSAQSLKPGNKYWFYLNHLNEIVYAYSSWEHETLYILETGKTGNLDKELWVKGLNASGEIQEYALSDKLNWVTHDNGTKKLDKEEVYTLLNSNGSLVNRQLVKFSTDLSGKICEIVIAFELSDRSLIDRVNPDYPLVRLKYYSDPAQWPQDFLTYVSNTNKHRVSYSGGIFGHFMPFTSATTEMIVPFNSTLSYAQSDVHSWIWTPLQTTPTAYVENFDAYGSGDDCVTVDYLVSAIGTRTSKTGAGYNMQPYLVLGVSKIFDEQEGEITKLKLSNRNGIVSDYYLADEELMSISFLTKEARAEGDSSATLPTDKTSLASGDIISVQLDSKGKIERLRLIYDGKNQRDIHPESTSVLNTTGDIIKAEIIRKNGTIFEIKALDGSDIATDTTLVFKISNGILEYDARLNTVKSVTPEELYGEDIVHIYLRYGSCRMVVIYKNL